MAEYSCFQIQLTKSYCQTDWKEDIKNMLLTAGLMRRETVFIFSDTQVNLISIAASSFQLFKISSHCSKFVDKIRIFSGRSEQHTEFR